MSIPDRGAVISDDGAYRYRLWRTWDPILPVMVWVLLNPSVADAQIDDPTVRKCRGFAAHHQHGGIVIVNLFAWRATYPNTLRHVADPVGPDNDQHLREAAAISGATVIAGWGTMPFARTRAAQVKAMLGSALQCFQQTANGPWHPLYLPYASPLVALA